MPCLIHPIQITASGQPGFSRGLNRVAKPDLLQSLQMMLSSPNFRLNPGLLLRDKLFTQLEDYRVVPSRTGSTRVESGKSDDIAMALALAAWPLRKLL